MNDLLAAVLIALFFVGVLMLVLQIERLERRVKKLEETDRVGEPG